MSPSHLIVPLLKMFTRKSIVIDAGWPLLDGYKSSGSAIRDVFGKIKNWCIDFLAFKLSDLVLVESQTQAKFCSRKYFTDENKFEVSYTGFDENSIQKNEVSINLQNHASAKHPYIFFRGKVNPEAGIENILNAFFYHRINGTLRILTNQAIQIPDGITNVEVINSYVSQQTLFALYESATICLGQLSSHPRLEKTIPHKAFEAAFHGKPYLTMKTSAILEIFPDQKDAIFIDTHSPKEIALRINKLLENQSMLNEYASSIRSRYRLSLSQEKLNSKFTKILRERGLI
jgi:glycosyltransferase involved in cell wall biosynthesis